MEYLNIPTWVMRFLGNWAALRLPLKGDLFALWAAQGKRHCFAVELYPGP